MHCPHCGRDLGSDEDQNFCSFCGRRLHKDKTDEESSGGELGIRDDVDEPREHADRKRIAYCPWEDQEHLGLPTGLVRTLKESVFQPDEFFHRMPQSGGFLLPLLFALIVQTLGVMVGFIWSFVLENPLMTQADLSPQATLVIGLLVPMFVLLGILVSAVIVHTAASLLNKSVEPFEATFRVICYSSGPELFTIIPVLGGLIALIWKIHITVVGLRVVHRMSALKAVGAIVIPFALLCGLFSMLLIFVSATVKGIG